MGKRFPAIVHRLSSVVGLSLSSVVRRLSSVVRGLSPVVRGLWAGVRAQAWRRTLAPLALVGLALALQTLAGLVPARVDSLYSRGVYRYAARLLAPVGRLSAFSLAEVLLAGSLVALCAWVLWQARRLYLRRVSAGALLFSSLVKTLWFAGVGLLLFLLVWGLNYQRETLAERLHVERREARPDELELVSRAVIEGINRNYEEAVSHDGPGRAAGEAGAAPDGASRMPLTREQLFAELAASFARVPLTGDDGRLPYAPPKPVYFSGLFSRMQISGVFSPFTGEPNFNALTPDPDLPFTVAHEMAHQRGFAREDEASFVAFLVCTGSADPYVRYSGYLNALGVLGIHARVAPGRARELYAALAPGPRADLRARYLFWARYAGRLGQMTQRLNNAYLKANRVRSGVRNYNEVNRLIIGYYLLPRPDGAGQTTTRP